MCDNSACTPTHVEITQLKLVADAATLLSDPVRLVTEEYTTNQVSFTSMTVSDDGVRGSDSSKVFGESGKDASPDIATGQESEDDEVLSVVEDINGSISEALLTLEAVSEISLPKPAEIENSQIMPKAIILEESNEVKVPTAKLLIATVNQDSDISDVSELKASAVVLKFPDEKTPKGAARSVFELDCIPLWGSVSMCGGRPEMEDAVATVPRFIKLPIRMLIGNRVVDGVSESLTHLTSHFFGVYDGHGGPQVANYCRDRIHLALAEELGKYKNDPNAGSSAGNMQMLWQKAFTSCFQTVDDEIGGKGDRCINQALGDGPNASVVPVAPETVGSTAVVALVCSSHIIVANCGDSRAVLCRGKEAMALSVDHKPNREDEQARIEASGGKVIQWHGHRILGVLAMSRSIGDRYFKPLIIPDPEVMFVPRARDDECLILATDGLWDVMTNEEACENARRRILVWHKRNGVASLGERGNEVDPAAQAAADHLSKLAFQRGSKDNLSVIVFDLKAQRKFKTKS